MNRELVEKIRLDYKYLTGIICRTTLMEMGENHIPTQLNKNEQGVYVFFRGINSFKVGKAGPNSQARWNSHHYNLDQKTPSTFTKSFMADLDNFVTFFPKDIQNEIRTLNSGNIKMWIRLNLSRIEFKISSEESNVALNLLEALVQFHFPPLYEGRINY